MTFYNLLYKHFAVKCKNISCGDCIFDVFSCDYICSKARVLCARKFYRNISLHEFINSLEEHTNSETLQEIRNFCMKYNISLQENLYNFYSNYILRCTSSKSKCKKCRFSGNICCTNYMFINLIELINRDMEDRLKKEKNGERL